MTIYRSINALAESVIGLYKTELIRKKGPWRGLDDSVYHHVVFDHLGLWCPKDYPDSQLPYDEIQFQLAELISAFPTLKTFTYDQYGGFVTVPLMRRELRARGHGARVREETFTEASNTVRAERFKSAAGLGWVHCPRDRFGASDSSLLEAELKFLQEVNGRVRAQSAGPVRTKDLTDCVMVVSSELLADQLTRLPLRERLGETRIAAGAQGGYHSTRSHHDLTGLEIACNALAPQGPIEGFEHDCAYPPIRFGSSIHGPLPMRWDAHPKGTPSFR